MTPTATPVVVAPEPPPQRAHPLSNAVVAALDDAAGLEQSYGAPPEVVAALLAALPDACGVEKLLDGPAFASTSASLDDGDELVVLLGPLCATTERSLVAVVDRDDGRPFVRAARMEPIQWPQIVGDEDGVLEIARRVPGPTWSKRTFEPLRMRLSGDALVDVPPKRFVPRAVPPALGVRLAKPRPTRRERTAIIADVAALLGADACEWDREALHEPAFHRAEVNLDDDASSELAVLLPDACIAPHGGWGVLLVFDREGAALTLTEAMFASFVGRPLIASSRSRTIFVEQWDRWGSHGHASELVALRREGGSLATVFSIPADYDFYEASPEQKLEARIIAAGDGFIADYRGKAAIFDVAETFPELEGTVLDGADPYPILEFRARVRYVWNDATGQYDRIASGVSAEAIERFAAHGVQLVEHAEPWLETFRPQLRRRARTDKGVALLLRELEKRWAEG